MKKKRYEYLQETITKQTLFLNIIGIDISPADTDFHQDSSKENDKVVHKHKPGEPSQQMRKERKKSVLYFKGGFFRRWEKIIKTAKKVSSQVPLLRMLC